MEWFGATIGFNGFSMVLGSGNHWFRWFSMVVHHWSADGMVTYHRWSLIRSMGLAVCIYHHRARAAPCLSVRGRAVKDEFWCAPLFREGGDVAIGKLLWVHEQGGDKQGQGGESNWASICAERKEGSRGDEEGAPIEPVEPLTGLQQSSYHSPGGHCQQHGKLNPNAWRKGRHHHACWHSLRWTCTKIADKFCCCKHPGARGGRWWKAIRETHIRRFCSLLICYCKYVETVHSIRAGLALLRAI